MGGGPPAQVFTAQAGPLVVDEATIQTAVLNFTVPGDFQPLAALIKAAAAPPNKKPPSPPPRSTNQSQWSFW
jgi:hypothetical protein